MRRIVLSMQGVLRDIKTLPTRQLPHMAADANVGFDVWQQIHFGSDVLTWMQHMAGLTASVYTVSSFLYWAAVLLVNLHESHVLCSLIRIADTQGLTKSSISGSATRGIRGIIGLNVIYLKRACCQAD